MGCLEKGSDVHTVENLTEPVDTELMYCPDQCEQVDCHLNTIGIDPTKRDCKYGRRKIVTEAGPATAGEAIKFTIPPHQTSTVGKYLGSVCLRNVTSYRLQVTQQLGSLIMYLILSTSLTHMLI